MNSDSGRRQRKAKAEWSRQASLTARDIAIDRSGELVQLRIKNIKRRAACRESLAIFCRTYNPDAFAFAWCDDHLKAIARIEEAALHGALYGFAMPRGSGKSTIVRMATLWAISYGWCRYVFAIGANDRKAQDTLGAVKMFIRFLPEYAADFPEISYPVDALGGIAQRASGQLFQGQPTLIEWSADRIVLAVMPPPVNWPKKWRLRSDGMVPTSGSVISASGLTGDGIRGSLMTLRTGEQVRPDLVLLDDPQTPESARSASQNTTREQLIAADVLGMAGPGKNISAVMPCTVIAPGDMVDNLLDRSKHPLWRGERTKLLRSMPNDLIAWDQYFDVYRQDVLKEPPDFTQSNAYYQANRIKLDDGAEASWQDRKLPSEVSAIQHAMHLYYRNKRAFMAEYQNDPLPLEMPEPDALVAEDIVQRVNQCPRGTVPLGCTHLTGFIDVQGDLLFWLVCGWTEAFGGAVVDYGAWPEQKRGYFTLADARPTLTAATGIPTLEGSIYAGLERLTAELLLREWSTQSGGAMRMERCLVDEAWGKSTLTVRKFYRQSPHAGVMYPSRGAPIQAHHKSISEWVRKEGQRMGDNWVISPAEPTRPRIVMFDANHWKSFIAYRLRQPMGESGAINLFGTDPGVHRMFSDHCLAETKTRTKSLTTGREVDVWELKAHKPDNHWWDGLIGCAVAASVQGVQPGGVPGAARKERRRVSWAEMQQKARAGR